MKDYRVELISEGVITQIPDSQKVFGALVYLFADRYGNEEATKLTKGILHSEIKVMLSSVMPSGYLPTPQDYLLEKMYGLSKANGEGNIKEQYSAIKERSYMTYTGLVQALGNPLCCADIYPYISVGIRQQLRASIDSVRYNIPELENKLYSVPITVLEEWSRPAKKVISGVPANRFCFYLKIDDSQSGMYLLEMLVQAAADKRSIFLGKRASQGMNLFQIDKITGHEETVQNPAFYLNTGMLLPDAIDFGASTLRLFTSERRPYEMLGGWEQKYEKQFISFIAEGSMISAAGEVENTGKSIVSPFNKARDIIFGNAYMYPLPEAERAVSDGKS